LLQEAKAAVDEGAEHFRALTADFEMKQTLLRDASAFEGGYGMEGQFRDGLARFGAAWMRMIEAFVEDEWKFATFLEGFSTRLEGTHNLYQELESRAAGAFDEIGRQPGGDR
jgi:hypothetical protein